MCGTDHSKLGLRKESEAYSVVINDLDIERIFIEVRGLFHQNFRSAESTLTPPPPKLSWYITDRSTAPRRSTAASSVWGLRRKLRAPLPPALNFFRAGDTYIHAAGIRGRPSASVRCCARAAHRLQRGAGPALRRRIGHEARHWAASTSAKAGPWLGRPGLGWTWHSAIVGVCESIYKHSVAEAQWTRP